MYRVVSGQEMKQVDQYTILQIGVPSLVLMERAAYQAYRAIQPRLDKTDRILVVAGVGNNGADGVAVARMLKLDAFGVDLQVVGNLEHATEEWKIQYEIFQKNRGHVIKNPDYHSYDVIIDGIFGIGLSREIRAPYDQVIQQINESAARNRKGIYSLDIPSGVDSATGQILGVGIKADLTVTFGAYKTGMLLYPGAEYCGEILVEEIGHPLEAYDDLPSLILAPDKRDLDQLPQRFAYSNKGSYGKLCVIAGSPTVSGAAYLCGRAALLSGAGMVRIWTARENRSVLETLVPEAMITDYGDLAEIQEQKESILNWADGFVIGPGLGMSPCGKELLELVLHSGKLAVIDADGLNLLAKNRELLADLHPGICMTPHLGEMSRLIEKPVSWIQAHLIQAAENFSQEYQVTVVLKDARTITAGEGKAFINLTGNNGMATAGSGDVLAGITGAFWLAEKGNTQGASMAVAVHGLCGDLAEKKTGVYALNARHLVEQLKLLPGTCKETDQKEEYR